MSGAQLSNYATYLVHPEQAPLSIVLTALSTAAGVFLTPLLALVLLGARIPVDAASMALSIVQIVLVPVLAGVGLICYSTCKRPPRNFGANQASHASTGPRLPGAGAHLHLLLPVSSSCSPVLASIEEDRRDRGLLANHMCLHTGLACSTYFPGAVAAGKPFFTFLSLLDTCACVGASLASNAATARSGMGLTVLLPVR